MIESLLVSLGGLAAVARACGVKKGTPWVWKQKGSIPSRYWPALMKLGSERGVTVDLVELALAAEATARKPRRDGDTREREAAA